VLGGDDDGVDAEDAVIIVVANRDLALAVGAEEIHGATLAHIGKLLGQLVRQHDGQRHKLGRVVAGVAKHHALIASAELVLRVHAVPVHALLDVRRLLLDRDQDAAGLVVETHGRVRVADLLDHVANDGRIVQDGARGDFTSHHDEAGLGQRLARHTAGLVLPRCTRRGRHRKPGRTACRDGLR
jgi:hypothetical protein